MPAVRTVLWRLKNLDRYLSQYHQSHRSVRFEELICHAFARLLHLPFFDSENDNPNKHHRVTWLGKASPLTLAPAGPDGIARAHNYCLVIEATRKTGTVQWSQEFARCLDHARNFARREGMDERDIYVVLLTTRIHNDTYESVKNRNARGNLKIVLIEVGDLAVALETACLAFTIRHLETRRFFLDVLDCLSRSDSLSNFKEREKRCTQDWQKTVLELEKNVVLAIRSYRVMMKEAADSVAVSQIYSRLTRDPLVRWYFGRADGDLDPADIAESLKQESLGASVGKLFSGEELFCPVPLIEFKSRCQRRLNEVERIHGGG